MSNDLIVREVEQQQAIDPATPATPATRETLAQVAAAVRQDSQSTPAAYLAESRVPHGGE